MILRYYYYFGIFDFDFNTCIYFSERNGIISSELYSFFKMTRFFRKPLYQPRLNNVKALSFVNGKFKLDDNFFSELFSSNNIILVFGIYI